jgi:C1A family cysteine protease
MPPPSKTTDAPTPPAPGRGPGTLRRYGWLPDRPDQRDLLYTAHSLRVANLPPIMSLHPHCPPVLDQGALGSCTANAVASAYSFDLLKQGKSRHFTPSRLFIYYNKRLAEGTLSSDSGSAIRDSIKSITRHGVCSESRLPYNPARFAKKPGAACYREARVHQALTYMRLSQSLSVMKSCLAAGYPFVFGFSVYESFESDHVAQTGRVNLPSAQEKMLGGHAALAVGYDDHLQRLLVQNSWGSAWGQDGYFTVPYAYVKDANLAEDFWTIRVIES